jgi:hypothetical protein
MEFLTFDPSEYRVLEDIEFDETIQRPEAIRFYTLEEQTTDAFEKLLPAGRVTSFQRLELQNQVDRLKDLYQNYVTPTAETYELREPTYQKKLTWVYPVYVTEARKVYDFSTQWAPLFRDTTQPGFYPRMIAALPKPFADTTEGIPYVFSESTEFLDSDGQKPIRGLPVYQRVRTQLHEDRTISIVRVPIEDTTDVVRMKGYYLAERTLDVPNPLLEHPFLKDNKRAFVESTAPLDEVTPSLDAVLTHAVPVTSDPYRAAEPYLKLWDVKLQDIPWSSWKSKFPPVEIVAQTPAPAEMTFPTPAKNVVAENITNVYKRSYSPGVAPRHWLMSQIDGGQFVVEMLLSKAIDNGSVESVPGVDIQPAAYPETTLEECNLTGKTFQEFMITGLVRRTFLEAKRPEDKYMKYIYNCVPLEFIRQERARIGYINRTPWKETTAADIIKHYMEDLVFHRIPEEVGKKVITEPKTPARPESLKRKEVLAILDDPHRLAEDKLRDIQEILRDAFLSNNLYSDAESLFVACAHTLAVLGGDFAEDRRKFYDTWTVKDSGFRVCKYCGEQIVNEDYEDQTEFTAKGLAIRHADALPTQTFHGEGIASFTTDLRALQPLFAEDAVDQTAFLLLSILQVLPSAEQLTPMLQTIRAFAKRQFEDPKKSADMVNKRKGVAGLAAVALLLQSHIPALVPRRSFGATPLKLAGYPRDAPKPEDYSIVDSLMMVLRKTFEAYPTSFKGLPAAVIRGILGNSKEIRTATIGILDYFVKNDNGIRSALQKAKSMYEADPPREEPNKLIPIVFPPKEMDVITRFGECPSARPILSLGAVPKVTQAVIPLRTGIEASAYMQDIVPSVSLRERVAPIPKAEIQARYKKKPTLKVPIRSDYRTNIMLASRLADIFELPIPIRNVDPEQKQDELRDIAQGFLFEMLNQIQADPVKRTKFEELRNKDVALYTLFADYKEDKASVNKLRATERMKFVENMARKTDMEREILTDLLRIGMAPYIITNRDREVFAQQAERLRRAIDDMGDEDIGVGQPNDYYDQGEGNPDQGNYGDYMNAPNVDGRDMEQPALDDDEDTSI